VAAEANNGICSAGVAYEAKIGGENDTVAVLRFHGCMTRNRSDRSVVLVLLIFITIFLFLKIFLLTYMCDD